MHPELLSSLAAEHRRDLAVARSAAHRVFRRYRVPRPRDPAVTAADPA